MNPSRSGPIQLDEKHYEYTKGYLKIIIDRSIIK